MLIIIYLFAIIKLNTVICSTNNTSRINNQKIYSYGYIENNENKHNLG